MKITTHSAQETQEFAEKLARQLQPGMVISLIGDLGAGKTTFTQGLGRALGVQRLIKSPTYTLVKEYACNIGLLLHIDAYRLEDVGGMDLDLPSLTQGDTLTVIEWAEFIQEDMPESYLEIHFYLLDDGGREIMLQSHGKSQRYEDLVDTFVE